MGTLGGRICAILLGFTMSIPAQSVTTSLLFPSGTVSVRIDLSGQNCNDGSALICISTPDSQRGYLLGLAVDDDGFVTACYRTLMQREADPSSRAFWFTELERGLITRVSMVDAFIASPEYKLLHP